MTFLILSFVAGVLTVLAPCILPILPVIIGGSVAEGNQKHKAYRIIGALIISIILFTLILKWSTALINIPQSFWQIFSGAILIGFALTMIFPGIWEAIPFTSKLSISSNKLLGKGYQKKGFWGDIIMGAALGPVFSSCSPTYFIILATVLPQSFGRGLLYLAVYALGLGLALLIISLLGQKIISRFEGAANPKGWFKRSIGILFLIVGVSVISGLDKKLSIGILDNGYFDITKVETKILQEQEEEEMDIPTKDQLIRYIDQTEITNSPVDSATIKKENYLTLAEKARNYKKYREITKPSGFVNTDDLPITISQYVGKNVVIIDFMTYSCINCQRTFPYLKTWYEAYHKEGLEIIAIHTPEFAFEKDKDNVIKAMQKFGLTFPVVLDNEYGTWAAYKNNYWPRKYIIDIDGYIVYDHIGEGEYTETEEKIVELLNERAERLGLEKVEMVTSTKTEPVILAGSPETYLGGARQGNFANESSGMCTIDGMCTYNAEIDAPRDSFVLGGTWKSYNEYVKLTSNEGTLKYHFIASDVYFVAEGIDGKVEADILLDGQPILQSQKGTDVNTNGKIIFDEAGLYHLIDLGDSREEHTVEIMFHNSGLGAYTFTFG